MNVDIAALRAIERDKDIPFDTVLEAIETALLTAYKHTEGHHSHSRVEIDRKTGVVRVLAQELNPDGTVAVVEPPKARSVQDRLPERTRRVQMEALVRFQRARVSYPDDLVVEALGRFVLKCGRLFNKADQAAATAAMGTTPEALHVGSYGLGLDSIFRELTPKDDGRIMDGFHALWKKDRATAMRLVATALFFDNNQGSASVLGDAGNLAAGLKDDAEESAESIKEDVQWAKTRK